MASPGLEPTRAHSSPLHDTSREDHGSASAGEAFKKIRSPPRNGIPPKRKPATNPAVRDSTPTGVRDRDRTLGKASSRTTLSSTVKRPTSTPNATLTVRSKSRPSTVTNGDTADSPRVAGENERPGQGKKRVSIVEPPGSKSPTKKRSISTMDRRPVFGKSTVRDLSTSGARARPSSSSSLALRPANGTSRPSTRPSPAQNISQTQKSASKRDPNSPPVNGESSQPTTGRPLSSSPSLGTSYDAPVSGEKPKRPTLPTRKSTQSQTIEQRLREMSVVHEMLRIAMADDGDENDSEKEEYGRQFDQRLAGIREQLEEARRQEGKDVDVAPSDDHDEVHDNSLKQIKDLEEKLAASNEVKEQLTETVHKLETELRELMDERAELGDHVSSLRSDGTSKDNALSNLQSNLKNVTSAFSSRMVEVKEVTDEQYEKYQVVRDRLNHASLRIDAFGDKMETSVNNLRREKDESITHLRVIIDKLQDQIQQLHEQNERDLSDLKNEMREEYEETLNDLRAGHDEELNHSRRHYEREAAKSAQDHAKAMEDLRERLNLKRAEQPQTGGTQTDDPALQDEAMQTTETPSASPAELESLKKEHEIAMSDATNRVQALEQRLKSTHNQLMESQETIRNLLEAKIEDDKQSDKLEPQLTKLREDTKFKDEEATKDRKRGAEARDRLIMELETVRQQLKLTNESLTAKEAQLQSTTARARELSQQARTAHQASERHRSITVKTMDELKTAQTEVERLRGESKDHEVIALREAVKVSQQHQDKSNEELQSVKETASQQQRKIAQLEEELQGYRARTNEELQHSINQQQARITQLEDELQKHQSAQLKIQPPGCALSTMSNATKDPTTNSHTNRGGDTILGNMAAFKAQIQNIQSMNDDLADLHQQSLKRLNAIPTTRRYDRYGLPVSPESMSGGSGDDDGEEKTKEEEEEELRD